MKVKKVAASLVPITVDCVGDDGVTICENA
jgi:hypothetical protein